MIARLIIQVTLPDGKFYKKKINHYVLLVNVSTSVQNVCSKVLN